MQQVKVELQGGSERNSVHAEPTLGIIDVIEDLHCDAAIAGEAFAKFVNAVVVVSINKCDAPIRQKAANMVCHMQHLIRSDTFLEVLFYQILRQSISKHFCAISFQ